VTLSVPTSAEIRRAFDVARDAIRSDFSRTRAALVALAISMAIVVCLTTLVERGRAATIRALERTGLNNLYLVNRAQGGGTDQMIRRLTRADAERLARLTSARSAVAIRMDRQSAAIGGKAFSAPVYAVAGPLAKMFRMRARDGRLLGDLDAEHKFPFAVVGNGLQKQNPGIRLGSVLTIAGRGYEVVGQLAECVSESAAVADLPSLDWNNAVLVPLGAEPGSRDESDTRYPIDLAVLSYSNTRQVTGADRLSRSIDPERYAGGPVRLASPYQTLRQYRQARRTFDRLVWLVALLTAASGVLSISNLLSASVIARTREIGVRRAVGARTRDILLQFQVEGMLLGLLGGGAGLIVGLAISLASMEHSGGSASVPLASYSLLAASCVAIGILTGIRPSQRAARIDPAAALRDG
jgi:ABC-type antimicrobial peptide transport system permease subunit